MLQFAIRNLFSRPLRSVLALLGLTVAIAGMVGLFSVAAGLSLLVDQAFGRTTGLVAMQEGALIPVFSRLPAGWAAEINAMPGVHVARPEVWSRIQVLDGKVVFNPPRLLFGVDVAATNKLKRAIFRDDLVSGRFLTEDDAGTFDCLVSSQISKDLRKTVGDTLRIDGFDAPIVGVYESGSLLLDMAILMHQRDVRKIAKFSDQVMSSMYIEPDDGVDPQKLIAEIRQHFRGRQAEAFDATALSAPRTGNALADLASDMVRNLQSQSAAEKAGAADEIQEGIEIRTARDWVRPAAGVQRRSGHRLMVDDADRRGRGPVEHPQHDADERFGAARGIRRPQSERLGPRQHSATDPDGKRSPRRLRRRVGLLVRLDRHAGAQHGL